MSHHGILGVIDTGLLQNMIHGMLEVSRFYKFCIISIILFYFPLWMSAFQQSIRLSLGLKADHIKESGSLILSCPAKGVYLTLMPLKVDIKWTIVNLSL